MYRTFNIAFLIRPKRNRGNADVKIYMRLTLNGVRTEICTGISITPDKWNPQTKRAKGFSQSSNGINENIDQLRSRILSIYTNLTASGNLFNVHDILELYNGKEKPKTMLLDLFNNYINYKKPLIGIEIQNTTFKKYEYLKAHIIDFLQSKFNIDNIEFEKLNYGFLIDFESYLKTIKRHTNNTAVKHIQYFLAVIKHNLQIEAIDYNPFVKYKSKLREVNRGYLTSDELNLLQKKDLPIARLETVRDVFLFCCYTGLAFIDIFNLSTKQVIQDEHNNLILETFRKKTNTPVRVILIPQAVEIFAKYNLHPCRALNNLVFPVISNQKMNAYLKEIATLSGIEKNLTTHLARHTFATTITLQNGISIESVSKMLGHKNIKTTQIYAKITDHKVNMEMKNLISNMNKIGYSTKPQRIELKKQQDEY